MTRETKCTAKIDMKPNDSPRDHLDEVLVKKKLVFDEILVVEDVLGEILVVKNIMDMVVTCGRQGGPERAALVEEETKQKRAQK